MPERIFSAAKKDLGEGFVVRRSIPRIGCKHIGPFVFWDHMGPVDIKSLEDLVVRPHPHIGLATMTWLFDGAILHRDSLANEITIKPGAINWMTAGSGITHSERSAELGPLEAIQLWIALPKDKEDIDPSFEHYKAEEIPELDIDGQRFTLIAGSFLEKSSPVAVYSPLVYLASEFSSSKHIKIPLDSSWEYGIYLTRGSLKTEESELKTDHFLYLSEQSEVVLDVSAGTNLLIFGGAPLDQEIHLWWNLVSSDPKKIHVGAERWRHDSFPKVPGETTRIPYPENRPLPKIH